MNGKSTTVSAAGYVLPAPHAQPAGDVLAALQGAPNGLGHAEAAARLHRCGRNTLPAAGPPGIVRVFLHQFASPLIYVQVRYINIIVSFQKNPSVLI